jgi:hypothetical protein
MRDDGEPRKRLITGRSAKDRARARADSAAKAEAVAKKRRAAMETRVNIAVGAKAMSLAPRYPVIRRLLACVAEERRDEDVGAALKIVAQGADPLNRELDFDEAWTTWNRVRRLNEGIETKWSALDPLLQSADDPAQGQLEQLKDEIEALALEWEALVEAEHPIGRLMRAASSE